eukprot:1845036-Alexandrium_andersonii.AAC.1
MLLTMPLISRTLAVPKRSSYGANDQARTLVAWGCQNNCLRVSAPLATNGAHPHAHMAGRSQNHAVREGHESSRFFCNGP